MKRREFERFQQRYPQPHQAFFSRPYFSRRAFLQGVAGIAGSRVLPAIAPAAASARGAMAKGTARNFILILLSGRPSHVDAFDLKMTEGVSPAALRPERVNGILWPMGLLPKLDAQLGNVAVIRSMRSWALVHETGQRWVQVGRNPLSAKCSIAPHIGSIIARQKEAERRPSDSFPPFVALELDEGAGGWAARAVPLDSAFGQRSLRAGERAMELRALLALVLLPAAVSAQTGVWESLADYLIEAFEISTTVLNGQVFAACGLTAAGAVNRVFIYDPLIDTWAETVPLPLPNGGDHCNLASAHGNLCLLGALVRAQCPALAEGGTFEFDPATLKWTRVGEMPTPRAASGVAVVGTKIYVAGGISGNTNYAAMKVFDVVTREPTRLPDMPTRRDHLVARVVDEKIYAIAGHPGRGQNTPANEKYDPVTVAWRARAAIPTLGGGMASGVFTNRIVLFLPTGLPPPPAQIIVKRAGMASRPMAARRDSRSGRVGIRPLSERRYYFQNEATNKGNYRIVFLKSRTQT